MKFIGSYEEGDALFCQLTINYYGGNRKFKEIIGHS